MGTGIFIANFVGSLCLALLLYSKGFLIPTFYANFGATFFFFGLATAATGVMVKYNEGRDEVIWGKEARLRGLGLAGIGAFFYLFTLLLYGASK